jgi:2-alkyl-3-oxoalkanoate reductase
MKTLVTGATGLIGSYLAERLVARGYRVRALARPSSDTRVLDGLPIEWVHGDLRDFGSLRRATDQVDVVFHCAARMSDWGAMSDFYEDNVRGTRNLMEASLRAGVKRFVHTSSTGVLGLGAQHNAAEEGAYDGEGVYEETKVAAEQTALDFARSHGLPTIVVRPSWVLGPRARRHIPLMLDYIERGILLRVGNGNNVLTFVDPRDAAEGLILAAESPRAIGQIYHLTNGDQTHTQNDLYRILARELGARFPRIAVPYPVSLGVSWLVEKWALLWRFEDAPMCTPARVKFLGLTRTYSCAKAMRELGYRPAFTLEQSLADAVQWYRAERSQRAGGRVRAFVPQPRSASIEPRA